MPLPIICLESGSKRTWEGARAAHHKTGSAGGSGCWHQGLHDTHAHACMRPICAASPPGNEAVAKKAGRTQMTPLQKEVLEASYTREC